MGIAVKRTDGNVPVVEALVDTIVGDVVEFSTHSIAVAQTAGVIGEEIAVDTRGCFDLPADTAEAFVVGDLVKWDSTTDTCLSTGTVTAGTVIEGKGAGIDSTILVKIG